MADFIAGLNAAWTFLINVLNQLFSMYTTVPIFVAVFALWVLDRVFGIFDLIK